MHNPSSCTSRFPSAFLSVSLVPIVWTPPSVAKHLRFAIPFGASPCFPTHNTTLPTRAHRWTGVQWPRTPHTPHNTPRNYNGEQEPSCPGHRTCNIAHRACRPVNRSQVAQDTTQSTQQNGHKCHPSMHQARHTKARWPRTPHDQHNTRHASTRVNRGQVAQDTEHAVHT